MTGFTSTFLGGSTLGSTFFFSVTISAFSSMTVTGFSRGTSSSTCTGELSQSSTSTPAGVELVFQLSPIENINASRLCAARDNKKDFLVPGSGYSQRL